MKTGNFKIAGLVLLILGESLSIQSCKKEEHATTAPVSKKQIVSEETGNYVPGTAFATFPSLKLASSMGRIQQVVLIGSMPCIPVRENCLETVVVTPRRRKELDQLYSIGKGSDVSRYFSDEAVALEVFPNWNADYFSDVKAAILSGKYAFYKASETTDLMVEEGKEAMDNYVLAFQYDVQ